MMDKHDGYIAREGFPIIFSLGLAAMALVWMGFKGMATAVFAAMLFVVFFFRNPERVTPGENGLVVSPADVGGVRELVAASPAGGWARLHAIGKVVAGSGVRLE